MNLLHFAGRIQSWPRLFKNLLAGRIITWTGRQVIVPHERKWRVIRKHAKSAGATVFVETGTFHGDTTAEFKNEFKELHTIELFVPLYNAACARFKDHPKIKVWNGDSAVVLTELLQHVNETCLFWLDGHYSGPGTALAETGECPLVQELEAIFRHPIKNHAILIDDAWIFGVIKGYPTIREIKRMVLGNNPKAQVSIENEIIVIRSGRSV